MVSLAGCGGGSGSKAAAAATSASSATAAAGGTTGAPGAAGFAAYAACLSKNGVTLPTGRPGGFARPSGSARPTARPSGGFRGGGAFGLNTADPKTAAAVKACAALRPTGGFGGGNNAALQSQLTAYRSCLSDHGVTLPTPAAGTTPRAGAGRPGGFGGLGGLNTADPKTAAAVKACEPLRPTFAPRAGAPTPTVTPST